MKVRSGDELLLYTRCVDLGAGAALNPVSAHVTVKLKGGRTKDMSVDQVFAPNPVFMGPMPFASSLGKIEGDGEIEDAYVLPYDRLNMQKGTLHTEIVVRQVDRRQRLICAGFPDTLKGVEMEDRVPATWVRIFQELANEITNNGVTAGDHSYTYDVQVGYPTLGGCRIVGGTTFLDDTVNRASLKQLRRRTAPNFASDMIRNATHAAGKYDPILWKFMDNGEAGETPEGLTWIYADEQLKLDWTAIAINKRTAVYPKVEILGGLMGIPIRLSTHAKPAGATIVDTGLYGWSVELREGK